MPSRSDDSDGSRPQRSREMPAWLRDAAPAPTSVNAQSRSSAESDHTSSPPKLKKRKVPVVTEAAEAQAQATLEGLTLVRCSSKSGYLNVSNMRGRWTARIMHDGQNIKLGTFDTAEAAALAVARSPEGKAAWKARYLSTEQAIAHADNEGLTLVRSTLTSGYANVYYRERGHFSFVAGSTHTGELTDLGPACRTAEHAALYAARFLATA